MKNKRFLVFFVVIIIALTLAACERSASTPPPGTTYPTLEGGTSEPMEALENNATLTAVAQAPDSGSETEGETPTEGGETAPTATPEPEEPEATPVPPKDYPVPDNYTLQKGEFPYCIARRFDISPGALLAANGLNSLSASGGRPL